MNWKSFSQRCCAAILAFGILAALTSIPATAQTAGAGSIAGTVTDSNRAIVPGASVTVTNIDTGVSHAYTTNTSGLYVAPFLQPGHYKVDATASNFGTVEART